MKINKQELIKALEIVRPGLANKEMIEQSTSFAFMDGKVVTYNDEISISHPVPDLGLEGAVKANELYQLLNKTKKEEIDLDITDSEIRIKAGRAKAGITLQEEVRLPLDELGDQGKWKKVPGKFLEALKFTLFSCSNDMSKPVLTCIHVNKNGSLAESSDNYRLTRHNLGGKLPVKSFLIPNSSVKELIKYPITHIAEGQGWVHFKTGDETIFSCRIFEDNYPDTTNLWEVEGDEIELPRSIDSVLDRAGVFAKQDHFLDENVSVILEGKKMKIRAEGNAGWFEEVCKTSYGGEPVSFSINPSFLQAICNRVRTCILSEDRMKFIGEDWEHVLALTTGGE